EEVTVGHRTSSTGPGNMAAHMTIRKPHGATPCGALRPIVDGRCPPRTVDHESPPISRSDPMDAGSPEEWRWIWLIAAALFGIGELSIAGSFFLAPFAVGALIAAVLAFAGVAVSIEWLVFIGVSVASLLALRPLARRLDLGGATTGIGSNRQIGQIARVVDPIAPNAHTGTVRLGAEPWRAETGDGRALPAGSIVSVVEVRGTRLIVRPDPTAAIPDDI